MNIETRYYRRANGVVLKLDIATDDCSLNPRYASRGTVMVCFHGRYELGDVQAGRTGKTTPIPLTSVLYDNSRDGASAFADWARGKAKEGEIVIASLELYDHSGISIHVSGWGEYAFGEYRTGWDSCIVGWCVMAKEWALKNLCASEGDWRDKATAYIKSDVEEYNAYLTGDVYACTLSEFSHYTIVENGVEKTTCRADGECEELCRVGGFFGDDHAASGLLDCLPADAERIAPEELPTHVMEAAA